MTRPLLALALALQLLLAGCAHNPASVEPASAQPPPEPVAVETPEDKECQATLRKYTCHDNWLDNHPVLNGMVTVAEIFGLGALLGLAELGGHR